MQAAVLKNDKEMIVSEVPMPKRIIFNTFINIASFEPITMKRITNSPQRICLNAGDN